jgi:hypothetical protein
MSSYRSLSYPTDPSRLISSNFCASTANSIGSLLSTSLLNPFTIRAMAFSVSMPRLVAVENLVLTDLTGCGFVFDLSALLLLTSMYGKVCAPQSFPMSKRVTLRKVTRVLGPRTDLVPVR